MVEITTNEDLGDDVDDWIDEYEWMDDPVVYLIGGSDGLTLTDTAAVEVRRGDTLFLPWAKADTTINTYDGSALWTGCDETATADLTNNICEFT